MSSRNETQTKKRDLTYKRKINGKVRYYLSDEVKLNDQTGQYCKKQVPKSDQPKLDDFVRDQMSGEMQE